MPTIDEFLSKLEPERRSALEDLREKIRSAVPEATETIAYGVPAFKLDGRPLVSYGAARDHCSFYVQSPDVVTAHKEILAGFHTSGATVHFTPADPIPKELVRELVAARVRELRPFEPQ